MSETEKLARTANGCLSTLAILAILAGLGCCVGPLAPALLLVPPPEEVPDAAK